MTPSMHHLPSDSRVVTFGLHRRGVRTIIINIEIFFDTIYGA